MIVTQILEQVINGLLAGAYYLLIALGLSLIFSLGGLVNLAHGAFYALGAYFAVKLGGMLGFAGVIVASPVLVALLGLVVERFLFRRFYRADPALGLLLTFGLAMGAEILSAAFVVVVIGGLGSFWGVVCAALIVGVVRGLTVYIYPSAAEASMYLLMVLVLLIRPRGLLGERILRFE